MQVEKAVTVTQNKLGDLWYRVGDLRAASLNYKRALAVRRGILAAADDAERQLAELDLALSLAKVADIEQVACEPPSLLWTRLQGVRQLPAPSVRVGRGV